jgi:4-hydroxybenzoate polyprenyltransferase
MIVHLKIFFKLVRWFHELLAILPFVGLYFIINYYATKNGLSSTLAGADFFLLCICVQLLIAAGCVLNDIMDRDIDRVNKPATHLIGRVISLKNAWLIFAVMTILIILLSTYISIYVFSEWAWISAGVYVLSILYDVYFKKSPLMGNILIACLASFIPLVLFFFAKDCIADLHNERIIVLIWLYAVFPFLIIIPRELSLDISDMEGDRAGGCRTLPIVIGVRKARIIVSLFILLIIVLSVVIISIYSYLFLPFLFADLLLIYYLVLLKKAQTRISYIRAGRFLWFVMIAGLIGFTAATVYF